MVVFYQVMQIKKKIDYDIIMTSQTPHNTHHEVVINHAKFNVCTPSSFEGVRKTDAQTELCFIQ